MADNNEPNTPEVQFSALEGIDDVPKKKSIKKFIFGGVGIIAVLLLVAAALLPSGGGGNEPTGRHDIGNTPAAPQPAPVNPSQPAGAAQPPAVLDTPAPPPPAAASEPASVTKLQVVEPPQKKVASAEGVQQEASQAKSSVEKKASQSADVEHQGKRMESVRSGAPAAAENGDGPVASKARCQVRTKKRHGSIKVKKKAGIKAEPKGEKTISPDSTSSGRPGYQLMFAN